jgi:hypothetical protein
LGFGKRVKVKGFFFPLSPSPFPQNPTSIAPYEYIEGRDFRDSLKGTHKEKEKWLQAPKFIYQ